MAKRGKPTKSSKAPAKPKRKAKAAVKPAHGLRTICVEPNAAAVAMLESVLERLRTSETVAVALVEVKRGGDVEWQWADCESGVGHHLTSGAATLLQDLSSAGCEA